MKKVILKIKKLLIKYNNKATNIKNPILRNVCQFFTMGFGSILAPIVKLVNDEEIGYEMDFDNFFESKEGETKEREKFGFSTLLQGKFGLLEISQILVHSFATARLLVIGGLKYVISYYTIFAGLFFSLIKVTSRIGEVEIVTE